MDGGAIVCVCVLYFQLPVECVLRLFSFQSEKDTAEARFTKLKLQAKAKMVALNKQIHELKGKTGPAVSDRLRCK